MNGIIAAVALSLTPQPLAEWVEKVGQEQYLLQLRQYWINQDIMEEHEWLFKNWFGLEDDINTMVRRTESIGPDTPPSAAKHHLPPHETATENVQLADRYLLYLEEVEPFLVGEGLKQLDALRAETIQRKLIWDEVRECTWQWGGGEGRRLKLERLKTLVGAEVFYNGPWPTALPPAGYFQTWGIKPNDVDD